MFNCLNCNNKSSINETIRLYNLDLQGESSNVWSFEDCKILSQDPILPRTKDYNCKNINCITHKSKDLKEAVFLRMPKSFNLTYICATCYYSWNSI